MTQQRPLHWWSSPRTLLRHILMLDDTAHSVALGTAIGLFIALTPTVGIQMILVMIFAVLSSPFVRFNRIAALITVYISNPLTMLPIYWFNYKIGNLFVEGHVSRENFARILQYDGFREWWSSTVALFVDIGVPLIVGSLIVSSIAAVATYPAIRALLRSVRGQSSTEHEPAMEKEKPAPTTTVEA